MIVTLPRGAMSRLSTVPYAKRILGTIVLVFVLSPSVSAFNDEPDSALGAPPGGYRILSGLSEVEIPFEVFRGDIRMSAEISGKPVRMMLDNGYMWDPLLIFGSPRIDSLNLHYDGEDEVGGPGSGSPIESRTASGIVVRFPGIEFTEQTAIVTPESSGLTHMWEGTEGQVSATFLKHFVVSIDFNRSVITLTEPSAYQYSGGGIEIPLEPLQDGAWGIPGTIEMLDGRRVSLDLMLDLGYNDQIQIVTGGPHGFRLPARAIEASLGFGVQGEIIGHLGRVRKVEIGNYVISDALAGFVPVMDSSSTHDEAMIGLGLLSRFNLVFDYPGHRMFIDPSGAYSKPYEYNMTGMWLRPTRDGYWEIGRILKESPAGDAGLQVGDKITMINGDPATEYGFWDLYPLVRESGETLELEIVRRGETMRLAMVLRRVI